MDSNTDIAEVATPVLKLWAQFARDEPGPGLAPRETYYRQSAFVAGMAGACTSLLTGVASFVHSSESLAVARCPPLWDDYFAEACRGEPALPPAVAGGGVPRGHGLRVRRRRDRGRARDARPRDHGRRPRDSQGRRGPARGGELMGELSRHLEAPPYASVVEQVRVAALALHRKGEKADTISLAGPACGRPPRCSTGHWTTWSRAASSPPMPAPDQEEIHGPTPHPTRDRQPRGPRPTPPAIEGVWKYARRSYWTAQRRSWYRRTSK